MQSRRQPRTTAYYPGHELRRTAAIRRGAARSGPVIRGTPGEGTPMAAIVTRIRAVAPRTLRPRPSRSWTPSAHRTPAAPTASRSSRPRPARRRDHQGRNRVGPARTQAFRPDASGRIRGRPARTHGRIPAPQAGATEIRTLIRGYGALLTRPSSHARGPKAIEAECALLCSIAHSRGQHRNHDR